MVRAGVVKHSELWPHGGYREIQHPPERYRIINLPVLIQLTGVATEIELQYQLRHWVTEALQEDVCKRDNKWTASVAVGRESFVHHLVTSLQDRARHKEIIGQENSYVTKEGRGSYRTHFDSEMTLLRLENAIDWADPC